MIVAALDWLRDRAPPENLDRRAGGWAAVERICAHRFLRRQGFVIVARNYRLASGDAEADLIAWEGETLVVVEVKSRASAEYGPPDRAIGEEKYRAHAASRREYTWPRAERPGNRCGSTWSRFY